MTKHEDKLLKKCKPEQAGRLARLAKGKLLKRGTTRSSLEWWNVSVFKRLGGSEAEPSDLIYIGRNALT